MHLRRISQDRPDIVGNGKLQANVFGESILDNALNLIQQVFELYFDPLAFQTARKKYSRPTFKASE